MEKSAPGGFGTRRRVKCHQYLRTDSSGVYAPNILKRETRSACPSMLRQHQCIVLHCEDGGMKNLWEFCLENNITLTVDYLPGVLNKVSDWEPRSQNSSSEWKLKPEIFHQIQKILGPAASRSICILEQLPAKQVHQMEARSICLENRCFYNPMERNLGYVFPNSQSYGQGNKGQSFNCISNTTVADAALAPSPTLVVHSQSFSDSSVIRFVTQSLGKPHPSVIQNNLSSGMESLMSNLISKGISVEAVSVNEKSRREGTRANYNSS